MVDPIPKPDTVSEEGENQTPVKLRSEKKRKKDSVSDRPSPWSEGVTLAGQTDSMFSLLSLWPSRIKDLWVAARVFSVR